MAQAGTYPVVVLENQSATFMVSGCPLCPALGERKYLCASHELMLPSALLLVPPAPQAAERACVPFVRTQDWGTHMRLELPTPQGRSPPVRSLPLSWSLPRGPGSDLIVSFPFLPDSLWVFLTALTVQDSFCLSPVSFQ